jgi:hypothetical protein
MFSLPRVQIWVLDSHEIIFFYNVKENIRKNVGPEGRV